jgi:hypothetical protein
MIMITNSFIMISIAIMIIQSIATDYNASWTFIPENIREEMPIIVSVRASGPTPGIHGSISCGRCFKEPLQR